MGEHIPSTVNYSGRQVDIELLQTLIAPLDSQRVHITTTNSAPKIVAGIEKLVQRYTVALLSILGEIHFDAAFGTALIPRILGGHIPNRGVLSGAFTSANVNAIRQLVLDDNNTDVYGTIPEDERIYTAGLLDYDVDYESGIAYLKILITSQAGDNMEFIVPTTAPR